METETSSAGRRARGWLLGVLGVAVVALVAYQMWPESVAPATSSSNRRAGTGRAAAAGEAVDPADLKVRLEALQAKRPDQGEYDRNPFRFRPPPAPPPPKLPPVVAPPPGPP